MSLNSLASPAVSVVMPARNALPFLDASVESILNQSWSNFEFVILDDCSNDGTTRALQRWAECDPRIRLFLGTERRGPVGSSNFVVAQARAPLIARMDADDVAHPERLARQVAVMQRYPAVVLVGTAWEGIGPNGDVIHGRDRSVLVPPGRLELCHPSVMLRKEAFDAAGGYREGAKYYEDSDLYPRLAAVGQFAILPEALIQIRYCATSARFQEENKAEVAQSFSLFYSKTSGPAGSSPDLRSIEPDPPSLPKRIHPEIYVTAGFHRAMAGNRARILSDLLLRSTLRLDRSTLRGLAIAVLGDISPRALQRLVARRYIARDRRVAHYFLDGHCYFWPPVGDGAALRPFPLQSGEKASRRGGLVLEPANEFVPQMNCDGVGEDDIVQIDGRVDDPTGSFIGDRIKY